MSTDTKRIHLLSDAEISDLYQIPQFTKEEKKYYFDLNMKELDTLKKYKNINTRLYFILQIGYFKARQQFYTFSFFDVKSDALFILKTHLHAKLDNFKSQVSRNHKQKQKGDILKLFNYRGWSDYHRPQTETHLWELVKTHPKTQSAFRELLIYLEGRKIIIPSYRTLQDIFTKVLRLEKNRLNDLTRSFPKNLQKKLLALIHHEDGLTQLNIMRADQKDFQFSALRLEVEKAKLLSELYPFCQSYIPKLNFSNNAIRYYADLTEQYAPARLRRLNKINRLIHLLCFVYHRYQQFLDNMVITFIYHVRALIESGKSSADMAFLQHGSQFGIELPKLAQFLKWFPRQMDNNTISVEELRKEAYEILPKEQFSVLAQFIDGRSFDKKAAKWKFYKQSSRLLALYLRPILLSVNFEFYKKDNSIMALIQMLKNHYEANKPPSALKFTDDLGLSLPKSIITYLKANPEDKNLDPHLLEFYVYQKMYHHFNRGRLFCNDSVSFKNLENDLVADNLIDSIDEIAEKSGYSKISIYCDDHLDNMLKKLDEAWDTTLKNIELGKNHGIEFTKKKTGETEWRLLYDAGTKEQDSFFRGLSQIEISNLVKCIGNRVDIWKGFQHSKDKYTKRAAPSSVFLNAGILAEAFGIGVKTLSDMSDLNYAMLRSISKDCITVENLSHANDLVSNYIYSLPIFKGWNLLDDKLLADVDGQKFTTSSQTIQSRYSGKYFGTKKGISLYTLLANFVAVNAKNIGPNEYEGHSLYDMVYGNNTDIPIDSVTGDNHSLNQLNFIVLDSIDVAYIPSMKNIKKVSGDLCSLKPSSHYTGFLKPKRKIDISLIKSQKRGILRVLLSLLTQENTQSTIIRKLNSHSRYGRLRAALIEYNNIFKSIHVLNLINDMDLRKSMRTARNRTEAYHQFQSLIRKVYRGVFSGKKIIDNQISAHATRLVANCSVAYNATILNGIYEKMLLNKAPQKTIERFLKISPIAWSHISFTGKYNFKKSDGEIDFDEIVTSMEKQVQNDFDM